MANEREEGLAALQNGDFATAQTKLEAAIAENPQDAQAHLYLGGVYHQQGRHADAARILTRSTELLPMSSQAQYNLGIALEALGSHSQALDAYRKANALQDNYPLAQQGIERMQNALQGALPTGMYGTAPATSGYEATTSAPAYAPPAAPAYGAMPPAQPYMQDQTQPVAPYAPQPYAAPPAQPGYAPPPQPGYVQPSVPPGYAQPTAYGETQQYDLAGNPIALPTPAPGMGVPPPGPAGYQGQQWSPYPAQGQMAIEDNFNLVEAYKGWFQLIFTPRAFFAARQGASGFMAPLAMFTAYMVSYAGVYMIIAMLTMGIFGAIGAVIGSAIGAVIGLLVTFIIGGIIHGVSRLFGGRGEYSGSVGSYIYSLAPMYALMMVGMVISMGFLGTVRAAMMGGNRIGSAAPQGVIVRAQYSQPSASRSPFGSPGVNSYTPGGTRSAYGSPYGSTYGSPYSSAANPFAALGLGVILFVLLLWVGLLVWMGTLLGMGLCATQELSTGGAVGTVIVSFIVMLGIGFMLGFAMFAMMASAIPH